MSDNGNAIALRAPNTAAFSFNDLQSLGGLLAQSGYFKDAREAAQAFTKIMAGRELGVGPVAAMTGIHIIEGKPTVSAGLMASAVKGSGKYDYRLEWQGNKDKPTGCTVTILQDGGVIGESSFSMEDAQAAGLAGKPIWKSYQRNMLFSRALSNAVRWYCPDVFQVGSVYTPEELGAEVDRDGNAINLAPTPTVTIVEPTQVAAPEKVVAPMSPRERYIRALSAARELSLDVVELPEGTLKSQALKWCQITEKLIADELAARAAQADQQAAF